MVVIKRLATVDADFTAKMDALLAFEAAADELLHAFDRPILPTLR